MNPQNELVIEAGRTERHYWRDLWRYRELFFFLAWRDVLVRYKQTTFGLVWALGRPLMTMLVFTLVFSKLANLPSDGVPYPLLIFAALLPWPFFSCALSRLSSLKTPQDAMRSNLKINETMMASTHWGKTNE